MLYFSLIKHALLGLDPCPLDRKTIGVKSCLCKHPDIIAITVVVIYGVKAGLKEAGGFHMLHSPVVAVYIVALYLMRRGRGAEQKALWKFSHFISP